MKIKLLLLTAAILLSGCGANDKPQAEQPVLETQAPSAIPSADPTATQETKSAPTAVTETPSPSNPAIMESPLPSANPSAAPSVTPVPALVFNEPVAFPPTDTSGMEIAAERRVESENYMGTYCQISIYDYPTDAVYEEAFALLAYLDKLLTSNAEGSEIDWINKHAGIAPVKVSATTFDVIKKALEISEKSGGALEITLGPIIKLWRIGFPDARVPSQEEITKALPLVNYKNVSLNEDEQTVFLTESGMQLDLGAVVKGYAADRVGAVLRRHGVNNAIVNLGGNILALGGNIQRGTDTIAAGIQDPYLNRNETLGIMRVRDKAVVTSGTYERYFVDEATGKRYHHIFDSKTGYPAENDLTGVAIICDASIEGDCYSTAVFALGLTGGMAFVENTPGMDAIFMTDDHKIYLTDGIKETFLLQSEEYEMME